jgi:uncharacterized membrane protein
MTEINHIMGYSKSENVVLWLSHHWIALYGLVLGVLVISPFLAPVFMNIGWIGAGKTIYMVYSFLCHQLPQRSYFLFGPKISYSLNEIHSVWSNSNTPAILRQFIGNAQVGWKVAWSDRMISMYSSLWIFGIVWGTIRKKARHLPLWGFLIFLLPMIIDGFSHLFSDFAGLGQGFRDSNIWLVVLTKGVFSTSFYVGDAWGSFNAWMRLISGVTFGIGIVWFGFPYVESEFSDIREAIESKNQYRARVKLENERVIQQIMKNVTANPGFQHQERE